MDHATGACYMLLEPFLQIGPGMSVVGVRCHFDLGLVGLGLGANST
jgi:hypothetical protein